MKNFVSILFCATCVLFCAIPNKLAYFLTYSNSLKKTILAFSFLALSLLNFSSCDKEDLLTCEQKVSGIWQSTSITDFNSGQPSPFFTPIILDLREETEGAYSYIYMPPPHAGTPLPVSVTAPWSVDGACASILFEEPNRTRFFVMIEKSSDRLVLRMELPISQTHIATLKVIFIPV